MQRYEKYLEVGTGKLVKLSSSGEMMQTKLKNGEMHFLKLQTSPVSSWRRATGESTENSNSLAQTRNSILKFKKLKINLNLALTYMKTEHINRYGNRQINHKD